jgi:transposase
MPKNKSEQTLKKRQVWQEEMPLIDAAKLIFIDESGANLQMATAYGRAERGQRVKLPVPYDRGPKLSMISAISIQGVEAALYGEWSTNGEIFLTFIETQLVPKLKPNHWVVMDNIKFHLQASVAKAIESKGAKVIFLPPYSPDFSPIENMWSKIKNTLRRLAPRSLKAFKKAIRIAFEGISKNDLMNWYKFCGYTTQSD